MCGRYVSPDIAEAERYFLVHLLRWQFERSYNVAPTQQVPVVRMADGKREGITLRWGLVPFFAKGVPPKYSTINATIEKLTDGPCERGRRSNANVAYCRRRASTNGTSTKTAARRPSTSPVLISRCSGLQDCGNHCVFHAIVNSVSTGW
jgi:SOS response associated peptidase (SRAP)